MINNKRMDNRIESRIIPSTKAGQKHGGKYARSSIGPCSRFILEGEFQNKEQDARNCYLTVKDLENYRIEGCIYTKHRLNSS